MCYADGTPSTEFEKSLRIESRSANLVFTFCGLRVESSVVNREPFFKYTCTMIKYVLSRASCVLKVEIYK